MLIDQLPELNSLDDADEVPVERGTSTYKAKITAFFGKFVKKIGDTITGNLTIEKNSPAIILKATNNIPGETPSSNVYSQIQATNLNGTQVGAIGIRQTTGKDQQAFLLARNTESGSAISNVLYVGVDSNGNRTISISDADPWLSALGLTVEKPTNVMDAASGFTLVTMTCAKFGKIAQFYIVVKNGSTAVSGSNTVATLKSGYRPAVNASAETSTSDRTRKAYVSTNGAITVNGEIAANAQVIVLSTYILA